MAHSKAQREIRCGVIGYGPAFGMGKHHLSAMASQKGFVAAAACDLSEDCLAVARADFPGIETYTDMGAMLRKAKLDLVAIILPHNMHAKAAIRCLNAGCHVVVEKPFALTIEECDRMIAAGRKNRRMISTFHNRHWDANIVTIMKHLRKIGKPFRWESYQGGWAKPRDWWRSDKKVSGGVIFDWGAHYTEWMLQVMPYEMSEISGHGVDRVWKHCTNEDELEAVVRFKTGEVASHTASMVAMAGKPTIRILGTKGAIIADHGSVTVHTAGKDGESIATRVPLEKAAGHRYYKNVADHILKGKKLVITAELGRRVIQVLDLAAKSMRAGKALKAKYK